VDNSNEAKTEQIVVLLRRRPDLVPRVSQSYDWRPNPLPSPEDYARTLLADGEFRALQLGTWLGTTDGEIISQAVAQVIPPFYRPEYDLLVNGLTLAAKLQAQEGQLRAGMIALGVISATLITSGIASMIREAA
jgi:hypothetical protein